MMKRYRTGLIIFLLVAAGAAWFVYGRYSRLEVWLWHLRHGTVAEFGEYTVPVPNNWYIENSSEPDIHQLLVRFDTDNKTRDGKWKEHAVIQLLLTSPVKNLDQWVSGNIILLSNENKTETAVQRAFDLQGDSLSCVGGTTLTLPGVDSGMRTWHCKSSRQLELLIAAGDADMNQVWEIISGIRRKR